MEKDTFATLLRSLCLTVFDITLSDPDPSDIAVVQLQIMEPIYANSSVKIATQFITAEWKRRNPSGTIKEQDRLTFLAQLLSMMGNSGN